jgi:hypothetical protein
MMQNDNPYTNDDVSSEMVEAFRQLRAKAKAPPDFLSRVLEQSAQAPLFPEQVQDVERRRRREFRDDVAQARAPLHDPLIRWLSDLWYPPLAGELATAADTPPQEKTFYLDEGTIRVTCTWWTATQDRPAGLWIQWHADVTRPGDIWVRFTRAAPEEAADVLAEVPLGSVLAGEAELSPDTLGFDPSRERWALALILREPGS